MTNSPRPSSGAAWPTRKRKANERARVRKIRTKFTETKKGPNP